jgi:DNA topoisomerase I
MSLPRELGVHPETGEMISASIGRFGPFIVHQKDFRSIKPDSGDNVYTITLDRALEIFREPKKFGRRGGWKKKEK